MVGHGCRAGDDVDGAPEVREARAAVNRFLDWTLPVAVAGRMAAATVTLSLYCCVLGVSVSVVVVVTMPANSGGTVDRPVPLYPQQTTVPSLFTAQMHVLRGLALAYAGNAREGMAESARGLDLGAPDTLATRSINYAYYTYVSARTALVAGDRGKAIELLGEAMRLRYFVTPAWLRIDPTWKSLRGDPVSRSSRRSPDLGSLR